MSEANAIKRRISTRSRRNLLSSSSSFQTPSKKKNNVSYSDDDGSIFLSDSRKTSVSSRNSNRDGLRETTPKTQIFDSNSKKSNSKSSNSNPKKANSKKSNSKSQPVSNPNFNSNKNKSLKIKVSKNYRANNFASGHDGQNVSIKNQLCVGNSNGQKKNSHQQEFDNKSEHDENNDVENENRSNEKEYEDDGTDDEDEVESREGNERTITNDRAKSKRKSKPRAECWKYFKVIH